MSEQEIRDVLGRFEKAMCARDAAAVMATYAPEITLFEMAPPLRFTKPDRDKTQAWMDGKDSTFGWILGDVTVHTAGDVAFCHGLSRFSGTEGEKTGLWFRSTFGLRRVDGEWRINHTHHSVPFRMDGSDLACLDLEP